GYGKTQWLLLLISGLLTLTSVGVQTAMSIIVIASQCEFETTQAEKGIMMASSIAGLFLSTYILGYVSDALGRRKVLLYGNFICVALQFIQMFVTSVWVFNIINLLSGLSLGGVSAALYAYLAEFNIPRHRAVAINYSTMFVSVSAIYVPATAWLVLSSGWDFGFHPWRLIMLMNLLPGLIGGLLLLMYPESPKLLLSQNKENEAVEAVEWISKFNRGQRVNQMLKCNEYSLKPEPQSEENLFTNNKGCDILTNIARATVPLFKKPHGIHFILCTVAVLGMFFSSNGMQFWFPEIVNRSSIAGNSSSSTVCEILDNSFKNSSNTNATNDNELCSSVITEKTYIDNMIVGVAFLIGFAIQGAILNPLGRKNVLLGALILSTLSGILLHFITNTTIVLILFCLYILLPGLSISIMIGAVVDLVPTHLRYFHELVHKRKVINVNAYRGKAVSLCMSLGRLGIIAGTNIIAVMLQPYCNSTFALLTIILF
ncbi:CG31103, partial [Drosophila busckii]